MSYIHKSKKRLISYIGLIAIISLGVFSAIGSGGGGDGDVTPPAGATNPYTGDASSVGYTSATLNGNFYNPSGYTTAVWYEYGTTTSYGASTIEENYAETGNITVSADITGLQQNTTYHFRLVTQNSDGTFYGSDKTFTTLATPQALASGLISPTGIAVDSTSVYWTESDAVNKVGTNGGIITTLATSLNSPKGIAIDSTNVYWTESDAVKKVSINGGTVTIIASGLNSPLYIVVDSTSVYWTELGAVKKASINGGTVSTLASGLSNPSGIAVDPTSVYWKEDGAVKKVGINGGTVTILASSEAFGYLSGLAIDSTSVYWTEPGVDNVNKIGKNGGTVTNLSSGSGGPLDIAVDSTNVYWTEIDSGTVKKVSINGGAVTTIALLQIPAYWTTGGIATDSTSVYWLDWLDSGVDMDPAVGVVYKQNKN